MLDHVVCVKGSGRGTSRWSRMHACMCLFTQGMHAQRLLCVQAYALRTLDAPSPLLTHAALYSNMCSERSNSCNTTPAAVDTSAAAEGPDYSTVSKLIQDTAVTLTAASTNNSSHGMMPQIAVLGAARGAAPSKLWGTAGPRCSGGPSTMPASSGQVQARITTAGQAALMAQPQVGGCRGKSPGFVMTGLASIAL